MADEITTPQTPQAGTTPDQTGATPATQQPQATPAPDGAGTPQAAQPTGAQPDAPNGPQTPQNGPQGDQNAPGGPQGQPGAPKPGTDPSKPAVNPNTPPPSEVHPAVQKAGIIHDIAQTLAGGPHTEYSIDPNTGKMTATKTPLSGKQIAQAIALAALSGGIAGLGERGPGATGRAAQDGFNQVAQQRQQQDEQAKQEAAQNYARQAAIAQTNFQTHQNALRLSQMELDYHKQFVDSGAPILKNIQSVGANLASGVRESDLLQKYNVTKDMAIADGVIENGKNPDGSTHWENTYTVIDPNKKIELPEDTAKLLADLRIPGYFTMKDGKAVPNNFAGTAPIKAGLVVNGLALAQSFDITEAQLNKQLKGLTPNDSAVSQFDTNLRKSIANGDVTVKGLQTIAQYAGLPVDQAVEAMQKDKVDPGVIQQYRQLIPAGAMDASKMQRESAEAARKAADAKKNLVPDKNNYETVLANPKDYSPEQVQAAQSILDFNRKEDARKDARDIAKAGAEARVRTTAELETKRKFGIGAGGMNEDDAPLIDPKLAPLIQDPANYNTPTGTNEKFLQQLQQTDPGRAAIVKAYANGMDLQSYYAAAKRFGGTINAYIHAYDPTFNANEMQAYNKTLLDARPGGPIGKANRSASTTFVHLDHLIDSIGVGSMTGMNGTYKTHANNAVSEMSNAYANGNKPGETEIAHNREALGSSIPMIAKPAARAAASDLMDKVAADWHAVDQSLPRGVQRPGFIDDAGADAYHKITGQKVDTRYIVRPKGATGTAPDTKTGILYWHDANGKALGVVPGQGAPSK